MTEAAQKPKTRRETVEAYAVVQPGWTMNYRRTWKVIGVGIEPPNAWRDAADSVPSQRLDSMEFARRNPDCKTVKIKATLVYEVPA